MVKKSHGEVVKILIMKDFVAKLLHIEFVFSLMCPCVLLLIYIIYIIISIIFSSCPGVLRATGVP